MQQKDIPTQEMEVPINELPTVRIGTPPKPRVRYTKSLDRAIIAGASALSLAFIYFIASSLYPDFRDIYQDRLKPFGFRYWPNFIAVLVLLVLGYNLFLFRGYKRFWFGISEIVFASGLGWYAVNKAVSGDVSDAIVIFFAALYLVGRGFIDVSSVFQPLRIEQK